MKKKLSLLLVLALIISLFAGLAVSAYADDDPATEATEAALEIYTQVGDEGEPVLAKAYTAEELAELAETKEDGYVYVYYKSGIQAVVTTKYVALDSLLADAGVSFAADDTLAFMCGDEVYGKGDFSYDNVSARGVDNNGEAVPTAVAIDWYSGSIEEEGAVAAMAAAANNDKGLRFVSGMTAEEAEEQSAAGARMPTGITSITVISPVQNALEIYTQEGKNGEPQLAKGYTADELAALAETKEDGYGYIYYKGDAANAVAATEYVALDALFSDAGVTFAAGDKLAFVCDDGPYTKGDFSYETMAARGVDGDGNPVPTAVAISWNNGSLADGTVADIAATAKNTGSLRFVSGMTAEEREGQSAAGSRMPSGVLSITVVSPAKIAFTDLTQDWYRDAVAWAVDNGVTNGTSATTFSPSDSCKREQVVTFLWRAANSPEPASAENPFTDVEEGTPYYKAILWAAENGITTGINKEGTLFDPSGEVTRAQFVTFLYRMQKVEGTSGNNPFKDVPAGQYYTDPVIWAAENGITTGTNSAGDEFTPNDTVTRGQAVTFLYRALG